MKKIILILLISAICISASSCASSIAPIQTPIPTETISASTESPEPEPASESSDGAQVIVSVQTFELEFKDPESGTYTILSYLVENPTVIVEGNDEATTRINSRLNEVNLSYLPNENAVGVEMDYPTYLQSLAEDNYRLNVESGADFDKRNSFDRVVSLERADENIICICFENILVMNDRESSEERLWFNANNGDEIDESEASKYLPARVKGNGTLTIYKMENDTADISVPVLDLVTAEDEGDNYLIIVEGEISNIKISRVGYLDGTFLDLNDLWYCNRMSNCSIQLKASVSDTTPGHKISFETASGTMNYIITRSIQDGSAVLMLEDAWNAVG